MTARTAEGQALEEVGRWWWLWLVTGVIWLMLSIVILQFDRSSARTVGVIIGIMFMAAGAQYVAMGVLAEAWNWLWYILGGILFVAGLVAVFNPGETFVRVADVLGFVFVLVGIVWTAEAFAIKESNPLWWFTLIAGIGMIVLGFWAGGQFLIDKAYTLLVFAGIWAMMRGFLDLMRAFQIRQLGKIGASF